MEVNKPFFTTDHYLVDRARLYAIIRRYFSDQNVLEVDVPLLGASAVTDPNLESLSVPLGEQSRFLQTSPEFFLKRVLADYPHSMYYLGKAFRANELGALHNTEFTMLEWYRVGYTDYELIQDVFGLIRFIDADVCTKKYSYAELFVQFVGLNPHLASVNELRLAGRRLCNIEWDDPFRSTWLDLLFTHIVEPNLPLGVVAVTDYPACQSALARVEQNENGIAVARRFEIYWNRIEVGNGYWELTDSAEQLKRFDSDNEIRRQRGLAEVTIDQKFLRALESGIPDCAGVAMGVDRLLACVLNRQDIHSLMAFSDRNI